jgi:hypothetical protein
MAAQAAALDAAAVQRQAAQAQLIKVFEAVMQAGQLQAVLAAVALELLAVA